MAFGFSGNKATFHNGTETSRAIIRYIRGDIAMRLTVDFSRLSLTTFFVSIFVSVEFPDAELLSFLKTYRKLKVKLCVDCITRSKGLHILNPTFLDRDLPRKIVTNGLEVHFKYTGQPVTCYRCGSTEHIVHNCPQRLRPRNNPSPPVAQAEKPAEVRVDLPAEKEPESNETADNTEDMESKNPASYAAMASQSLFGDTQDPSH